MKNVTISMAEADLAWVRAQAGAAGVSVSRWMADQVAERHKRQREQAAASDRIERFHAELRAQFEQDRLAGVVHPARTQTYREMIDEGYDERFRRFDHPAVSAGPDGADEGHDLRHVAEGRDEFQHDGAERTGSE
ncbi:hypothetical protein [Brevundimonas sp.]|jgi:hypothetical protein|uniref:hypothetical protein n=1 Tax=Brevundimonas sp. TaxID=1871086 RepID=UPI0037837921